MGTGLYCSQINQGELMKRREGEKTSVRRKKEDKGTAYPVQLSFVCWLRFFFPD